jgi:hypothetical protein
MSILIPLTSETEAKLRERAIAAGEDVVAYATRIFEEAVCTPSIDDLLAPFRQQVEQSGMSDSELDAFFEGLRDEVWAEQQAKRAPSA